MAGFKQHSTFASLAILLTLCGCVNSETTAPAQTPIVVFGDPGPPPGDSKIVFEGWGKKDPRPNLGLPSDAGAYLKCAACHVLQSDINGIGPSLAGVYGKQAASNTKFAYSEAMRQSGLVWDTATLDRFLEDPEAVVPGNKMSFSGLSDPKERAQIIALLERF